MKKWLFNPFIYIAGSRSLIIGWGVMLLTALISFYSTAHFDGVIDMHIGRTAPLPVYFYEQLADWGVAVIIFYPAGMLFSKSAIRFIDIAGTMALARWVMIFPALFALCIKLPAAPHSLNDIKYNFDAALSVIAPLILVGLISLAFAIWMIALMYHAFSISFNMKGRKATWVFIISLLIAEIASHLVLHQLYKHFI